MPKRPQPGSGRPGTGLRKVWCPSDGISPPQHCGRLGLDHSFFVGGGVTYCRTFNCIPALYPLAASNTHSPDVTTKNVPDEAKSSLGVPTRPWLRTAALTTALEVWLLGPSGDG